MSAYGIENLLGKVVEEIVYTETEITFHVQGGGTLHMYHDQDCCETVRVEDVVGDLTDLIGSPILLAEEVVGETPNDYEFGWTPESYTWTFYKLATIKGYVDIRWLGVSNGYYSESVTCSYSE